MNHKMRQQNNQACSKATNFSRKLLTLSIATIITSPQVFAQTSEPTRNAGAMEEVTVTAQRRTERALDVPISITSISSDQLGKGDVQQLSDISKFTPGLRFDNASAFSQPTIRGVGTAVIVAGGSSNVGIYTDGFYSPNPLAADFELLNVESVQVLKGPQGTLFGRNSTGGAILVTTSEPSQETRIDAEAAYGSYNTQRYQVYASSGLTEKLAFDVAGLLRKSDGFVDNILTGTDDDGEYDNSSIRVGLKLDLNDRTSALLRYAYSDREDNTFTATNAYRKDGQTYATAAVRGLLPTDPGVPVATESDEVSNGFKPTFAGETSAAQFTVKVDLDSALLTSYTQYREETGTHHADFDMSELPFFHYIYDNLDRTFSQEFLLSSNGDGALQWTTGLFYFDSVSIFDNNRGASFGSAFVRNGGSGVDVRTIAAFGDATYALRDDLYLTLGLRYSKDSIDGAYFRNPGAIPGSLVQTDVSSIDDNQLTPRAVLRFEPNDNSSVYLSYTEGYKSAILNVGGGSLDGIEVDPEEIKAYEVGYKYSAGSLMFDLSTYYYDYKNLQVAGYVNTASLVKNAANSTVYGVDGQVRYALSEQLEVNFGAAYLHAEYDDFDESQTWSQCLDATLCGSGYGFFSPGFGDASGNEMQRSPEFTATLGVSYRTQLAGGSLDLSSTLYHSSNFYFDSSEQFEQDAYDLLSARAEWTDPSGHYTLALYGDNLTDEEYRTQALPQFYGTLSSWGAPRTFGVSIGLHY